MATESTLIFFFFYNKLTIKNVQKLKIKSVVKWENEMVHMKSQIQSSQEEKQKVKALTGSGEQRCVISSFPFPISF